MKNQFVDKLEGFDLDHAVHLALKRGCRHDDKYGQMYTLSVNNGTVAWDTRPPRYSEDWSIAGKIIESINDLKVKKWVYGVPSTTYEACINTQDGRYTSTSSTYLVAVMRALVKSLISRESTYDIYLR